MSESFQIVLNSQNKSGSNNDATFTIPYSNILNTKNVDKYQISYNFNSPSYYEDNTQHFFTDASFEETTLQGYNSSYTFPTDTTSYYPYPITTDFSDGNIFTITDSNVWGSGTYNISGGITFVQNGGFELPVLAQGISSWLRSQMSTAEQTQFVWQTANPGAVGVTNAASYNGYPYPSPVQIGYISNSGPAIYQNVYLQAGNYTLSFYLLQRDATADTVTIYINNVSIATVTPPSETVWTYYSYSYTAVSDGTYEIKFGSNVASTGVGIDKVEITPTVNKFGRIFNRDGWVCVFNPNSQITSIVSNVTYNGDWISIQMPSAFKLKYYSFWCGLNVTIGNPVSWVVAGSNDNSTYYLIDQQTDVVPLVANVYRSAMLNISTAYQFYKFIFIKGSLTYNQISQLTFYRQKETTSNLLIPEFMPGANVTNALVTTAGAEPCTYKSTVSNNSYSRFNSGWYTTASRIQQGDTTTFAPWKAFTDDDTSYIWATRGTSSYLTTGYYNYGTSGNNTITSYFDKYRVSTSVAGEYLQIQFPENRFFRMSQYTLRHFNYFTTAARDWTILGSSNGTTWYIVDSQSNQAPNQTTFNYSTFVPNNQTFYNYYRMVVTRTWGSTEFSPFALLIYFWKITVDDKVFIPTNSIYPMNTKSLMRSASIFMDLQTKTYNDSRFIGTIYKENKRMTCKYSDNPVFTSFLPGSSTNIKFVNNDPITIFDACANIQKSNFQSLLVATDTFGNRLSDMNNWQMVINVDTII